MKSVKKENKFVENIYRRFRGLGGKVKSLRDERFAPQLKQQEGSLPKELLKGVAPIGIMDSLDPKILYWDHQDMDRFIVPKVLMGGPGSGKTTYLQLLINRFCALRHTVVVFDVIQQCEFTKGVEESLDPGMYEVWDFSKEEFYNQFSFNYGELYREFDENDYMKRRIIASLIQGHLLHFFEAINEKTPSLTVKSMRYLKSVAQIVFVHKDQTLNDFIKALSDYEVRQSYIRACEAVPVKEGGERLVSEEVMEWIKKLDKFDEERNQWVTNEEEIGGILTRLRGLTSDARVQRMLENKQTDACDFREVILNPKIIMIRVPQQKNAVTGEYGYSEEIRAMITAFITFKIWLIKEWLDCEGDDEELVENLLGEQVKRKDLHVVHLMYDEVHQFPQFVEVLSRYLKEFRKFRLGVVFTCHGMTNFNIPVQKEFSKIGVAYLLLSPIEQETVDQLKNCFSQITPQAIKEMERGCLAAHIPAESSYVDMIIKAPGTVQDFLALEQGLKAPKASKNAK